jgi:hypothetical protein
MNVNYLVFLRPSMTPYQHELIVVGGGEERRIKMTQKMMHNLSVDLVKALNVSEKP